MISILSAWPIERHVSSCDDKTIYNSLYGEPNKTLCIVLIKWDAIYISRMNRLLLQEIIGVSYKV